MSSKPSNSEEYQLSSETGRTGPYAVKNQRGHRTHVHRLCRPSKPFPLGISDFHELLSCQIITLRVNPSSPSLIDPNPKRPRVA
ncbi:hypothetical protein FJTKL_05147 [Diaporthe vaccinii]|uniref:Uncharacterized protein n=1 Tax=Diaporthe vaccinii TaxID=105482 RepID=A0ABR4FEM7_9PEZI